MKKICIAVVVLVFVSTLAIAAPRNASQAQNVVAGWLRQEQAKPLGAALGTTSAKVQTYGDEQGPLYHIVYIQPSGYAIVPADSEIEPIVGFTAEGVYDPSPENPLGALVSADMAGRMAAVRNKATGTESVQKAAADKWQRLETVAQSTGVETTHVASVTDVRVDKLVASRWNQLAECSYTCYNYYTPNSYPCGCVATAMSQLMRFYQYPVAPSTTGPFTIYVNSVAESRYLRGGNGSGGNYGWGNMTLDPDCYTTATQREAIGALTYDAGVSVNMSYASGGSGADTLQAATVLKTVFGYSNAIGGYNSGSNIVKANLNVMLNPNLDAGFPCLLGITGGPGGHAIVCDGYGYSSSTLYHHLNMGWSGADDAWYDLPGIDTSIGTFTSTYKCIYNVYVTGSGEVISGRATDVGGNPVSGVSITATRTGGGTYYGTSNAAGIYALPKVPSSSSYSISAVKTGYVFMAINVSTGLSSANGSSAGNVWNADFAAVGGVAVSSITPNSGAGGSVVTITNLAGVGFVTGATVKLTQSGQTDITATGVTVVSPTQITCTLTLPSSASGLWNVVVTNPDLTSGTLANGFTITMAGLNTFLSEGFESTFVSGAPVGWSKLFQTGTLDWIRNSGDSRNNGAHSGTYNALLYIAAGGDHKTYLITPSINFPAGTQSPTLEFWHKQAAWASDQDTLTVYYKTSAGGTWTAVPGASYTSDISAWTKETITLPNVSTDYYIGFLGNARYGYGVCIDDVLVTGVVSVDNTPPTPDPMTWSVAPHGTDLHSISMTATTATDVSGVEYYFTCTSGGGHDSSWQNGTTYVDSGLAEGATCSYTVKARDKSPSKNTTAVSTPDAYGTTLIDNVAPTPNPMTFAVAPAATGLDTITMTASTASDISGVEYFFTNTTASGHDSGWRDDPHWTDTGLTNNTAYTYQVIARDKSAQQNETAWSAPSSATTLRYLCTGPIATDLSADCQVDFRDYAMLAAAWSQARPTVDYATNGTFDTDIVPGWQTFDMPTATGVFAAVFDSSIGNIPGSAIVVCDTYGTGTQGHYFYQTIPVNIGSQYKFSAEWTGDLSEAGVNPLNRKLWSQVVVRFENSADPCTWTSLAEPSSVMYGKSFGMVNQNIGPTGTWGWEQMTASPVNGPSDGLFTATDSYMVVAFTIGGLPSSGVALCNVDNIKVEGPGCGSLDLNGDCFLNLKDIAAFAEQWLDCNRNPAGECGN